VNINITFVLKEIILVKNNAKKRPRGFAVYVSN